jgi:hypothetical protein
MNEKIKELWDKAVTLVEQEPDGDWSLDTIKEKFAELIIQECEKINSEFLGHSTWAALHNLYKQHFGVEL